MSVTIDSRRGKAVSKQRMSHWIVDTIALASDPKHGVHALYEKHKVLVGSSLADICRAAGWAKPNIFTMFYSVRVKSVSSRVLSLN